MRKKIKTLSHYLKLADFAFNRFKGDNYRLMREYFAEVLMSEVEGYLSLDNKKILDVGGAEGEFCKIISESKKCAAVNLEPAPLGGLWPYTVKGSADQMPFGDCEFEVTICRGVLEHIQPGKQLDCLREIYRVTKVEGLSYVMIPPWYNPHAGHQLKPFHVLPFKMAKLLRNAVFNSNIQADSLAELNLYPVTFAGLKKMIRKSGFKIIAVKDTHFRLHFLTAIPIVREIAVPAAAFILKKPAR